MPDAKVSMEVRKPSNTASVIDINGDVTAAAEKILMDAYNDASEGGRRSIILNFSGMDYMNSSGVGLLVTLLIRANRQRQKLLIYGLSEHYRHIFELTRLDEAISIHTTEAEALAAGS